MGKIIDLTISCIGSQTFLRSTYYKIIKLNGNGIHVDHAILFVSNVASAFLCSIQGDGIIRPDDWIGSYFMPFLLTPLYSLIGSTLKISTNKALPVDNTSLFNNLYEVQEANGVFGILKSFLLSDKKVLLLVQKIPSLLLNRFDIYQKFSDYDKQSVKYLDAKHFCILNFLNEGVVPLNFSGSYLTQSQMSCYELSVINLILPNTIIDSLSSLLTSAYPYVMLEINNVTMPSSGNKHAIYSNNPRTTNVTFICSISDVNDPTKSKFLKISSDGAVQNIKFSPADNLSIRILRPSGEVLKFQKPDFIPPSFCDPSLQIELILQIKRL
jgi:hypothetical protein